MGAKDSKVVEYSQDGLKRFEQNFQFLKTEKDPRFGAINIYQERSSGKFIAVQNSFSEDAQHLDSLKQELDFRSNMNHKSLAKIVGYSASANQNMCGSTNALNIYSEWFEHDLELEILERIPKSDYFTEAELWYMANSSIDVGAYFQQNGIYHGDLRPQNMMMDDEGNLLIDDHGMLNEYKDNYNKALSGNKGVYLSPSLLEHLKHKTASPSYDVHKADVFSLGVSLLFAANLKNPETIYDMNNKVINRPELEGQLQSAGTRYSPRFVELLRTMLDFDDRSRPDFNQLSALSNQQQPQSQPQQPLVQSTYGVNPMMGSQVRNFGYAQNQLPGSLAQSGLNQGFQQYGQNNLVNSVAGQY